VDQKVNGASILSNCWNFFVWSDTNYFLSQLLTMDETWLSYHYDPETMQQSKECKNLLEKFSPQFFVIETPSSSSYLII
jgi:hypothetical protein